MADKIIGLRINVVGTDDAVKKLSNIEIALEKGKQEVQQLNREFKAAVGKGNQQEAEELQKRIQGLNIQQKALKTEAQAVRKEIDAQQRAFRAAGAAAGSYDQLNDQLVVLRKQFKALSAEDAGGAVGKELLGQIDSIDNALKGQDARLGVFTRNVGNYEESVVRALRRVASEDSLQKELQQLNTETDDLIAENRRLAQSYEKVKLAGGDVDNITRALVKNQDQLEKNKRDAQELAKSLREVQSAEGSKQAGAAGVSPRGLGRLGRIGGKVTGAIGAAAGDLLGGANIASGFGAAGAAAFGVFAAGGLAVKAISVLSELSQKFAKLEGDVKQFSGANSIEVKALSVNVQALSDTFGKDSKDILKTTQSLSKSLGIDFATALDKVEQGLLTGAGQSDDFLDALAGAAEGARIAGFSIEDLTTASNEATQSGIVSERGLEIVNKFGEAVVTNSSSAKAALTDALGKEFTDQIFKGVQDGTLQTGDALRQVSQRLSASGIDANKAAKALEEAFGVSTQAERGYIKALGSSTKNIGAYIDGSNSLTRIQQQQLKANKDLAAAQSGLAATFERTGINAAALGTQIQASLTNAANSALLFFNSTFGNGVAAALDGFTKLSSAVAEQGQLTRDLEQNYAPLLDRYDELNAKLVTLDKDSTEAAAAQAELADIVKVVGDRIPSAITVTDAYSRSLGINTKAARDYIAQQQQISSSLATAQAQSGAEALQTIQRAIQENEQAILTGNNRLARIAAEPDRFATGAQQRYQQRIIEAGQEIQRLAQEAADVEAELLKTSEGRTAVAADRARRRLEISQKATIQTYDDFTAEVQARIARGDTDIFTATQNSLTALGDLTKEELEKINKETAEAAKKGSAEEAKRAEQVQADRAKRAADDSKRRAEEAQRAREKLLTDEEATRKALEAARKATSEGITQLTIEEIGNNTEREISATRTGFAKRIETETQGLRDAAAARVKTLEEIRKQVGTDSVLRAQFGTAAEVQQQIEGVNAATEAQIAEQTRLLLRARDKQITELQESRQRAISEAVRSVEAEALGAAQEEVQKRLELTQGGLSAIELQFTIDEQAIETNAARAQAGLRAARAAGLITEGEFAAQSTAIEQEAAEARIDILVQRIERERTLRRQEAEQQKLLIEGERLTQLDSIDATLRAREEALKQQREQDLLTEEQYLTAVQAAQENAAALRVLTDEAATQAIAQNDEEFRAAQLSAEGEVATATADLYASALEARREAQQAALEDFARAAQTLGDLTLQGLTAVEQFAEASELRRRAEIDERYDAEIAAARGNAGQIAALERQRAQEEERLDRQAAARRKAIAIAQAAINGALAITNILATTPDPTGLLIAARVAFTIATTAAQVAVIAAQPFAEGGAIPSGEGMITGRAHAQGGVRGEINGRTVEVEGGEWKGRDEFGDAIIINRRSTSRYRSQLAATAGRSFAGKRRLMSDINEWGGGVRFASGGTLPAPQVGAAALGGGAAQAQELMQGMQQQMQMLGQFIAATNSRIDRLTVVADAQKIIEEGAKGDRIKQTQVL